MFDIRFESLLCNRCQLYWNCYWSPFQQVEHLCKEPKYSRASPELAYKLGQSELTLEKPSTTNVSYVTKYANFLKLKTFCYKTHIKNSMECAKKFYYMPILYAWNRGAKIQYANYKYRAAFAYKICVTWWSVAFFTKLSTFLRSRLHTVLVLLLTVFFSSLFTMIRRDVRRQWHNNFRFHVNVSLVTFIPLNQWSKSSCKASTGS